MTSKENKEGEGNMTIKEIIKGFPKKYICVKNTVLDKDELIIMADIIRVFDTLEIAKDHATEIRNMMKQYIDFDIVYGDYEDYVNTRKGKKMKNHIKVMENTSDKLSQEQIDMLIQMMGEKK